MSRIINQNTEPLFIFDMPDDHLLSETISVKGEKGERGDPTKLSDLENDEGFITKNVSDLTNYYSKTATDGLLGAKLDKTTFEAYEIPSDFFTGTDTVSAIGTNISLSNTSSSQLKSIVIYGDTAQDNTPTTDSPIDIAVVTGEQTVAITGSDTQSYVINLGSLEICAIDNYKDYIYRNDGKWYKHKAIGKQTMSVSSLRDTYNDIAYAQVPKQADAISYDNYSSVKLFCTHAKYAANASNWGSVYNINKIYTGATGTHYWIGIDKNTTLTEAKAALDGGTIYYVLAAAIDEEITDASLVAQLDALAAAKTSLGTTIITSSGSLAAPLSVEAFKNGWDGTVSGINNELGTKAAKTDLKYRAYRFDSIADMKVADLAVGKYAITGGYYSYGDGGDGEYRIVYDDDLVADGASVHMLDNGLKAVLIVRDGHINIRQFGAKGNGVDDDSQAIQKAIDFAQEARCSCFIPTGIFIVSKIAITQPIELFGSGDASVIKSIADNSYDAVISVTNEGLDRSVLHDFKVDGNSNNVSNYVDAIKFYIDSASYVGDKYTNIYNLRVYKSAGNGVTFDSTQAAAFREMRIDNVTIDQAKLIGFNLNKVTDSIFTRCTASACIKYGYYSPNGGSNKFVNCKAFWCGSGDYTTPDYERAPSSAFSATSDTSPQSGKTYYTRSGTGNENDYYEFTPFAGSSFDSGTTYYEMTTLYPLRYAGFYISNTASLIANCEAQDNCGDGFYISGSENKITNTSADNNGLILSSGSPVSYASQNKTQCYYGLYINGWQIYADGCCFLNHRNSSIGKSQKGCAFIRGGGFITVNGTQSNQVDESITIQKVGSPKDIAAVINNNEWAYNIPLSTVTMLGQNLVWQGEANCYLYHKNNTLYFRLIVKNTDGILNGWHEVEILQFPSGFRPKKYLPRVGLLTSNSGYTINAFCSMCIYENGKVTVRHTDSTLDEYQQLVIEGQFTTK